MKIATIKIPKVGRTLQVQLDNFVPRDDIYQHYVKPLSSQYDVNLSSKDFFITWYNEGQIPPNGVKDITESDEEPVIEEEDEEVLPEEEALEDE